MRNPKARDDSRDPALAAAYADCRRVAAAHYENFPVASLALPRRLRDPVAVLYAFARTADDIADEGDADAGRRLAQLDAMERALDSIERGETPSSPLFLALGDVVARYSLPLEHPRALLRAFRMDVTVARYANFGELMQYCRCSANPVGRMLLHLQRAATPRNVACSDAICTALQLINFMQDLDTDYRERGRIYIPQDEMASAGVGEAHFAERRSDAAMRTLTTTQIERARRLLLAGAPLGRALKGRMGLELRMIVQGGLRTLELLDRRTDVFARPTLGRLDRVRLLWRALVRT